MSSPINWETFLHQNEALLGIETFLDNFLKGVNAEELVRNIVLYYPQMILNDNLLKVVTTTQHTHYRLPVYTLLKIISTNCKLYDAVSQKNTLWRSIYFTLHPNENQSSLAVDENYDMYMQKLCVVNEYQILDEGNDKELTIPGVGIYHMLNFSEKMKYSMAKLLINDDIKKICIARRAIYVLNEFCQVVEYYLPYVVQVYITDILQGVDHNGNPIEDVEQEEEQEDNEDNEIKGGATEAIIKQNSKVIYTNVKEMLNFATQEVDEEGNESEDVCIAVLTYDGELFLHRVIHNISYSLKFHHEFMMSRFGVNMNRILNIQCCDYSRYAIAIEFEDHSIYVTDILDLFAFVVEKSDTDLIFVTPENHISDDNRTKSFEERYANLINKKAMSTISVVEIIPDRYYIKEPNFVITAENVIVNNDVIVNHNDDNEEENNNDDNEEDHPEYVPKFNLFPKVANSKEFPVEANLSFEQKMRMRSSRIFTVNCNSYSITSVYYFDNSSQSPSTLNVNVYNQWINKEQNIEEQLIVYEMEHISLFDVKQLNCFTPKKYDVNEPIVMIVTPMSYLQIKCTDVYYWLEIQKEVKINLRNLEKSYILNEDVNETHEDTTLQHIEEEETYVTNVHINKTNDNTSLQHDEETTFVTNNNTSLQHDEEETTFVTKPGFGFIDHIRKSNLIQFNIKDNIQIKDLICSSEGSSLYTLATNGYFLINSLIAFENATKVIGYNNNICKNDLIIKFNKNPYVYVPYTHYNYFKKQNRIERELHATDHVIFYLSHSPYAYYAMKE